MIAVGVDLGIRVKDVAGDLVFAQTTVARAFSVIGATTAVVAAGAVALVGNPAGVVQVSLLRDGYEFLANRDITLLLVCHECRLLSDSR